MRNTSIPSFGVPWLRTGVRNFFGWKETTNCSLQAGFSGNYRRLRPPPFSGFSPRNSPNRWELILVSSLLKLRRKLLILRIKWKSWGPPITRCLLILSRSNLDTFIWKYLLTANFFFTLAFDTVKSGFNSCKIYLRIQVSALSCFGFGDIFFFSKSKLYIYIF